MSVTVTPPPPTNQVLVVGTLSSDPVARELPSGDVVWSYEVTVRSDGQPAETVPVALTTSRPPRLAADDPVVVLGRVRRRFFRAGGATASRTEVVAERVVRGTRSVAVRAALRSMGEAVAAVGEAVSDR